MKISSMRQVSKGIKLQRFHDAAAKASAKCGKSASLLFWDLLWCSYKYGAGPTDYLMCEFYNMNAEERSTFLTRVRSAAFVKRVNPRDMSYIFNDKNEFAKRFGDLMHRDTVKVEGMDADAFHQFLGSKDAIIAKPVDGDCGTGIEKLYVKDFANEAALYEYVKRPDKRFGILEEVVHQHPDAARIHPDSINCVRVATFVKDGEPHVVYSAVKFGTGGNPCDNTGRGGITCMYDLDNGVICGQGHDEELNKYNFHPTTGIKLIGCHLPLAKEVKELALTAARRYPAFKYVGWDIAMGENGPCIIEGNDYPGYDLAQMPDDAPHPWHGLISRFEALGIEV